MSNKYIKDALTHLSDSNTYKMLSSAEAEARDRDMRTAISNWISKYAVDLDIDTRHYPRKKLKATRDDPFGYFYFLYKIHKTSLKTRPVCSECASTPHDLGIWVDHMLQSIVKAMPSYFKDSFDLAKLLKNLKVSKKYSIFSFDAISMYTNINTDECLARLTDFLTRLSTETRFPQYLAKALVEALALVMKNNRIRCGDIIVQQLRGIAMGMFPAQAIANLFVAIYEMVVIIPTFKKYLPLYLRFIDDGLAVWEHHSNPSLDKELI